MTTLNARSTLGFKEKVRAAFDPLMMKYGFRCVAEDMTIVRYESALVFLNVYHGRSSFELGIEIGRLACADETEHGYSLSELVRISISDRAACLRYYATRTPEGVKKGIHQLVMLVTQYGKEVLHGDSTQFIRLKEQRARWKKDYAFEVLAGQVRPKAEEAFREKDYPEVIRLYESIIGSLTQLERKKLDLARRKTSRADAAKKE